jgi:hypothetical protein
MRSKSTSLSSVLRKQRGVVPARGLERTRRSQIRRRHSRCEKALGAFNQGRSGTQPVQDNMTHVAAQPSLRQAEDVGNPGSGHLIPESMQLIEARLGCVAGD